MKKILIVLLIMAVLCMSIAACAKDNPEVTGESSASSDTIGGDDNSGDGGDTTTVGGDNGNVDGTDDGTDNTEEIVYPDAPEVDDIGAFKDDIVPNAKEDVVDDSYEWIG